MQELIIKMAICLLIALALGFLFGWLLKRAFTREKYLPTIDKLKVDVAQSKDALKTSQEELELVKKQFIHTQDELETSSLKITELEDKLSDYNAKFSMLQSTMKEGEALIQKEQKEKNFLKTQLDEKHLELEKRLKESDNQNEIINRLKEHHALLKDELQKLKETKESQDKELEKLSIMIAKHRENETKFLDEKKAQEEKLEAYKSALNEKNMVASELEGKAKEIEALHTEIAKLKENEQKFLDEQKTQESKFAELETLLNEKKMASIELETKTKEIDTLKQKNSELAKKVKETEMHLQKQMQTSSTDEGFFDKLEEKADNQTTTHIGIDREDKKPTKEEGFGWMKFAKKALNYVEKTSEEINKNADKVIREYKNR